MNEVKVNANNTQETKPARTNNHAFDPFAEFFGFPVMPFFTSRNDNAQKLEGFHKTKDGSYVLHTEVTGMKAENLDVEFQNGGIAIKGKTSGEDDGESYTNEVEYFFTLPDDADADQLKASLADGVLTFKVPAKAGKGAKKITIE